MGTPRAPSGTVNRLNTTDKILRAIDGADQVIEALMTGLVRYGLDRGTEVILFGDHLHMVPPRWLERERRRTLILLPFGVPRAVEAPASVFDIGPTILDAAGICYMPAFPWGRSLLSFPDSQASYPTEADWPSIRRLVDPNF
jgi:phosphoglycerol transferase MdoB-like AlkP superfamily enzyme